MRFNKSIAGVANPAEVSRQNYLALTSHSSSSKRVPTVLATEMDLNSATSCAACFYANRQREYCYEEGSFRELFPT